MLRVGLLRACMWLCDSCAHVFARKISNNAKALKKREENKRSQKKFQFESTLQSTNGKAFLSRTPTHMQTCSHTICGHILLKRIEDTEKNEKMCFSPWNRCAHSMSPLARSLWVCIIHSYSVHNRWCSLFTRLWSHLVRFAFSTLFFDKRQLRSFADIQTLTQMPFTTVDFDTIDRAILKKSLSNNGYCQIRIVWIIWFISFVSCVAYDFQTFCRVVVYMLQI